MSDNEATKPANLDVPDELRYTQDHVWVDDADGLAVVGVTAFAAAQLGELVFVDLPEPGLRVEAGDEVLELESSKAVEPLVCPVAGVIRYVNRAVADDPSVINDDPYGEGWILKIEPDDDQPDLLDAEQYAKVAR